MRIQAYTLNSFAKTEEGGNPAGVVLHADSLSEETMRKIAAVLGFSETAFVMQSDAADFKVRFFTPNEEVDLCGHATIAVFHVMSRLNLLNPGRYTQETKAGLLGVEIQKDHYIMMEQTAPVFSEMIAPCEIADSLRISSSRIPKELPVQVVSTGLRDIMIPVSSVDILHAISPNMELVEKLSRKYNTVGYHVFSLEALQDMGVYCRNFAPLYGIPEEAATGTSNGALACYLYHCGQINEKQAADLVFCQGYSMKKPSEIRASLTVKDHEICMVKIGGSAMNYSVKELTL
ncbi:MAG TPA: PhzF family phenazine biosynthesis protein [Lachnospiraceae bacterium]|nr:PhzF family phenazine biosynthesis protein [Lachnospiraceae bacterium]